MIFENVVSGPKMVLIGTSQVLSAALNLGISRAV